MPDDPPKPAGDLQFERAEFVEPKAFTCSGCKLPITDAYFDVNGHILCPSCHARVVAPRDETSGVTRFVGAAVLGLGAAAVGAAVWYLVRVVTHLEIGLIAIGIGILVGMAVRRGAGGRGGPVYQALAVLLTYLAIASANVPYVWNGYRSWIAKQVVTRSTETSLGATAPEPDSEAVRTQVDAIVAKLPAAFWLDAAWVVLKSPFMGGVQNVIGWLIIFFGLQQAWRLTRAAPLRVTGPFSLADSAAPT